MTPASHPPPPRAAEPAPHPRNPQRATPPEQTNHSNHNPESPASPTAYAPDPSDESPPKASHPCGFADFILFQVSKTHAPQPTRRPPVQDTKTHQSIKKTAPPEIYPRPTSSAASVVYKTQTPPHQTNHSNQTPESPANPTPLNHPDDPPFMTQNPTIRSRTRPPLESPQADYPTQKPHIEHWSPSAKPQAPKPSEESLSPPQATPPSAAHH